MFYVQPTPCRPICRGACSRRHVELLWLHAQDAYQRKPHSLRMCKARYAEQPGRNLRLCHENGCRTFMTSWVFTCAACWLTVSSGTVPAKTLASTGALLQHQVVTGWCQIDYCLNYDQHLRGALAPRSRQKTDHQVLPQRKLPSHG